MNEPEPAAAAVTEPDDAVDALQRLIVNNRDLERLEAVIGDFNPFVAMGWVRQELRHSAFLRWLLDPSESHGLGTYPLRSFLKEILFQSPSQDSDTPTVFDADSWDLVRTQVQREWERIDVLIRNDDDRFVVVIENKVDTAEHSNQLARYEELVQRQFPRHKKLFVFLTPGGDPPSSETYSPLSYGRLADLIDRLLEQKQGQLSTETGMFLQQYVELIRRHIVEESEVQDLCRRIYENHKQALDLIFEYRPDRALMISEFLQDLVKEQGLILEQSSKALIRFTTPLLDRLPEGGEGWLRSRRLVAFEIENYQSKVMLKLILGPGEQRLREGLHRQIVKHASVFNRAETKFYPKWWTFHGERWVRPKQYEELDLEEVQAILREKMEHLVSEEIPRIEEAMRLLVEEFGR